ncbi:MAG: lipoyl(octanoyl) transferase LipB [Rhodothermales bacterium]|nr:lipoyl(octanoyl) transferase LipB [Rhodothermales bacterium]
MSEAIVCHLGRVAYEPAWALQRRVQDRLIRAKRGAEPAAPDPPPHVVLAVEHPPVFTLGKNGDGAHLLADADGLEARGAAFVETDRGGDITYHGPGQLVLYPVLDLDRLRYADGGRGTDIHRYLRELEAAVIRTCADYGLDAGRVGGRTGVWIGPDARGPERKVCAMGIRCSRWVTMHGLALNLNTDLSYFDLIVPCGIADRGVTSLAEELGRPVDADAATARLLRHLAAGFGLTLVERRGDAAARFLDTFAPAPA